MTKNFSGLLIKVSVLISSLATVCSAYAETNNISLAQVTKDVSYLASDALKGRHNYSPEIRLAANYIAKRFQENGLVGKDGISRNNFLQKYQVTKITPQTLNLTINGEKISPNSLAMASTEVSFSWEMSNNVKKNGFEIHNVGLNDDMRATVSELNHQGGKHLILLNPAHKTVFDRYQYYFQQGTARLAQQDIQKNVGGVIVIALSTITTEKVDSLTISGISTISQSELVNVVGILPGTTKPEEIVLYSAHYDHLGVKNDRGNDIYNGADDNASGTTAIINLAQYYAKQGDNIEMIGKPSKFGAGTIWMTGMERSTLGEQLNTVLASSGKSIYKDPYPEQGLFYRSDNATLARLGVPAHSFSSTQLDKDEHYHQTSDDISSLSLTSLHQVIKTLAKATQPLVDGSITPSRIDKSLVKDKGLIF